MKHLYNCNFMYKRDREDRSSQVNHCFDKAHNISRGILDSFWKELNGGEIRYWDYFGECDRKREYEVRGDLVEVEIVPSGELVKLAELLGDNTVLIVEVADSLGEEARLRPSG